MNTTKMYYEIRPGLGAAKYLISYGFLTLLAKASRARSTRFFTEISSNIDRHILAEGVFEKGVVDLLSEIITKLDYRSIMIDVGANIGNHTVTLGSLFERVEAVEPHPALFQVLSANVLINRMDHVTCHRFGLADEDSSGTLIEPTENHGLARVHERSLLSAETFGLSEDSFDQAYSIELRSARAFLGQFADKLAKGFIKIDVEGMEQEILSAIRPLLEEHRPIVAFEWITSSQPRMAELVTSLTGYELWGISSRDVGHNRVWRSLKLLVAGRSFALGRIDPQRLAPVYPLALLIPSGAFGGTGRPN